MKLNYFESNLEQIADWKMGKLKATHKKIASKLSIVAISVLLSACNQDTPESEVVTSAEKKTQAAQTLKNKQSAIFPSNVNEPQKNSRTQLSGSLLNQAQRMEQRNKARMERRLKSKNLTEEQIYENKEKYREYLEGRAIKKQQRHQQALIDINDKDDNVRIDAITELDDTNSSELAMIKDLLLNDPNPEIRSEAIEALTYDESRYDVPLLAQALTDKSQLVVSAALETLQNYENYIDIITIKRIKELLNHPDQQIREDAQDTLEELSLE